MNSPSTPGRSASWEITWGGFCLLIVAVLLLAIGLLKTINLLTLLACCLLVLFPLNLIAVLLQLRHLDARWLSASSIVAGLPGIRSVEISYRGKGARIGLHLESRGADATLAWGLARLNGGEKRILRGRLFFPKRGRYLLQSLVLSSGYPFGLFRHWSVMAPAMEVLAWPKTGTLHRARFRRRLKIAAEMKEETRARPRPHANAQASFYGLRPYRPGDSPRAIHWRSSARRGELMVREFEDPAGEDLIVILDSRAVAPEAFEKAVELTATICADWCRLPGAKLALVLAGEEIETLSGPTGPALEKRLMDRLAVVACGSADTPSVVTPGESEIPSGSVVVVAAGTTRVAEMLRRSWQRPIFYLDALVGETEFYRPSRLAHLPSQIA